MTKVLKFPGNGLKRCEAVKVEPSETDSRRFARQLERIMGHYIAGWLRPEEVYQLVVTLLTKGTDEKNRA